MIFQRQVKLPKNQSFFLFGARGTGKTTLLRTEFPNAHVVDLLDPKIEHALALDPGLLEREVLALPPQTQHVVIDEIQRLPKLLDTVHRLIETPSFNKTFILTGSSARKLKAGGANLLAGRAFVRELFPLTFTELGQSFRLDTTLAWGSLPRIFSLSENDDKRDFLESYSQTYLKEEVWGEQLVRNLDPFRRFLEVAAIGSGKIINATKIGRDVGADTKTIQSYYQIIEDTLLGFHVDAYHSSVRKRLRHAAKFYLFDTGVTRSLARMLTIPPGEGTSYYGDLFEQLVITEIHRANLYHKCDFRLCYLKSAAGVEVDLVIDRPGCPPILVEIKSTPLIRQDHLKSLENFAADFPDADLCCLSRDPRPKRFGRIHCLPWQDGVQRIIAGGDLDYRQI